MDGNADVTIDLIGAFAPGALQGYIDATTGAATAAEVAANINAILANDKAYGLDYGAVADGSTGQVVLTAPVRSAAQSMTGTEIRVGTSAGSITNDCSDAIGFVTNLSELPIEDLGEGKRPVPAALYFTSYSITRPTTDYNVQKRFFTVDSARADLGSVTSDNDLMLAVELAFANLAPSVVVVQVDDTVPGAPTRQEWLDALEAVKTTDVITDLVLLTTSLTTQTDLKDHIEEESGPTAKHYRRGWFGMARSTNIGDKDTADTYVYRARRTLQVAADSPARGRLVLVAPPQLTGVSRDITLADGSTETVNLDTTYLAVAIAARKASFSSPAESLARKTVTGFNIADITLPWTPGERGSMASQGVMVVTYDAGVFRILDPVTTEAGGGGLPQFTYPSTTSQKDNVSRKVDQALFNNIVGVVPTDLSDFIIDIRTVIGAVLAGEIGTFAIGPYRNADNTTRPVDLSSDIEVEQSPDDPTKFFFRYWFNLRYPALRLFGEFSVDNPFFAAQAA
jgi:hypothetical protein